MVSLTPRDIRHHYKERETLPAHEKVIRPLLESSVDSYVYGLTDKSEVLNLNLDILIKEKGKYRLDKAKECITGHEYLWNATTWKRGSIVIIVKKEFDFTEIFRNSFRASLLGTPNSGSSASAIKKCKEAANKGDVGICFPASNGIEWIQIYTDIEHRDKLHELAYDNCNERDSSSWKKGNANRVHSLTGVNR